ncbi:MAG TPA: penicillin acylase family protein, partial [Gemmatimonadaceae bacterium]
GNIGWIAAGLMPKRSWSGLLPVPGTGEFEWTGFRTASELPTSFNPASGFIATANNDIRPSGYDMPLNYEFDVAYRAHRISDVLSAAGAKFTVDDMKRLQHDDLATAAHILVPMLVDAATQRGLREHWVVRELAGWDAHMAIDARAPLLFQAWKKALSNMALARLAPQAARELLGSSWLDDWDNPADALNLLPPAVRDSMMVDAVDSAVARLKVDAGADSSAWRWGTLHTAAFPHRIAAAFDLAPVPRGGYGNTVNATAGAGYSQQYGASYREILDVADWDRSVATSVPGQSGQPESEHYGDLLPMWARGEYFPMVFSRAAVVRETQHLLWLRPAGR